MNKITVHKNLLDILSNILSITKIFIKEYYPLNGIVIGGARGTGASVRDIHTPWQKNPNNPVLVKIKVTKKKNL